MPGLLDVGRANVIAAVCLVGDALEMIKAMHEAQNPIPNEPVFTDDKGESPRPDRVTKRFKKYVRKLS